MKRSLSPFLCAFSLVLALVGIWLAQRRFTSTLDSLAEQAVLQHQRNLFGYADTLQQVRQDTSPHMILDKNNRYILVNDKIYAGDAYYNHQRLMMGADPCAFALLDADGATLYTSLPDSIPEAALATLQAADTGTMRLCGQALLLCDQVAGVYASPVLVWMVTAADVSPAYRARTEVLHQWLLLQAVLTLAALLLARYTTALQRLNDRQTRFVADLTHELKTPLTGMIGYADLLRGGELSPEKQRRAADAIYHESTRLEGLSQQLLRLQSLQHEPLTLTAVPVAAVFEDTARSLPDCGAVLAKTCPEDAAVHADRVLLADLLRNLVLNAAHASAPGSTVELRCLPAGEHWRLEVADTGCGIPPEALPHLTEPFYRVDKARARANGGSGVGLALCADIAAAFGAKLEFASTVGRGTTVSLTLSKEVYPP